MQMTGWLLGLPVHPLGRTRVFHKARLGEIAKAGEIIARELQGKGSQAL